MDDTLKDSWQPEGPISKKIKDRIKKAGKRFYCNDNISEYIEKGELEQLQADNLPSFHYGFTSTARN